MLLFNGTMLIAGGSIAALVCLEKTAEAFGWHWLGGALKVILPLAAMVLAIYFLETNPLLRWLR